MDVGLINNYKVNPHPVVSVSTLFFFAISFIMALALSLSYGSVSILIGDFIGTMILIPYITKLDSKTIRLMTLCKIICFISVLVVYHSNISIYGSPYYHGGSDDLHFEQIAEQFVSQDFYWPWDYIYKTNQNGFYWLISLLMRVSNMFGGYHTISFRILNTNLLLAVAALTYRFFLNIGEFTAKQGRVVFGAIALFPNAIYLSSYVFRDTLYTLIILTCYALFSDIFRKSAKEKNIFTSRRGLAIIIAALLIFIGYWVRIESLYILIILFFISMLRDKSVNYKNFLLIFFGLIVLFIVFDKLSVIGYIEAKVLRYNDYRSSALLTDGNPIYNTIFSSALFPYGLILRFLFGLVTPLPTSVLNTFSMFSSGLSCLNVIIAYGTVLQILFLPFLFKNIVKIDKYVVSFVLVFFSVIIVTFTFRHFISVYPFMAILVFREFFLCQKKKRALLFTVSSGTLFLLAVLYLILYAL